MGIGDYSLETREYETTALPHNFHYVAYAPYFIKTYANESDLQDDAPVQQEQDS